MHLDSFLRLFVNSGVDIADKLKEGKRQVIEGNFVFVLQMLHVVMTVNEESETADDEDYVFMPSDQSDNSSAELENEYDIASSDEMNLTAVPTAAREVQWAPPSYNDQNIKDHVEK